MKTSFKLAVSLVVAVALGAVAHAADAGLAGKWTSQFESQMGVQKYTFEFKVEGEKVTGKATREAQDQKTETEIKGGKIVKDEVSFTENLKFQDQEIAIEYKGKLVGDELKLHRKVGEFAEYDIVAKRVVEKKP
jgi:hypothetical protein